MRKFGIKLQNFSKTRFSSHFAFSENLFKSLKINDYLKSNLDRLGFIDMTTIQKKSLPLLIEKTNCLLLSETGTGKSLCYLIPILNEILNSKEQSQNVTPEENDLKINKRKGAIILSPTKELCTQIYSFARRMDKENRVNIMRAASLCYKSPIIKFTSETDKGIKPKKPIEIPIHIEERLSNQNVLNTLNWNHVDLIINTPTHLEALMRMKLQKNLNEIKPKIIVLDEVDMLLGDPFFAHSTNYLLDLLFDQSVQIILSGASIMYKINGKPTIEVFSEMFKDLMVIETANFHRLPQAITHEVLKLDQELEKYPEKNAKILLLELIENMKGKKIIVFCNSGETVEELHSALSKNNFRSGKFYATLSKELKTVNIARFRTGEIDVLVTTDLAARGLDFKFVHDIIQFDFPKDILTLLHRFGRTARLGLKGHVISFITKRDEALLEQFNNIQERNEKIELVFRGKEKKPIVNENSTSTI